LFDLGSYICRDSRVFYERDSYRYFKGSYSLDLLPNLKTKFYIRSASPLVVRRTQITLSSIVVVCLPSKQEMQGSIPFVPFCCHSITLVLSYNKNI
jgi:hypothetical protein